MADAAYRRVIIAKKSGDGACLERSIWLAADAEIPTTSITIIDEYGQSSSGWWAIADTLDETNHPQGHDFCYIVASHSSNVAPVENPAPLRLPQPLNSTGGLRPPF